MAISYNQNATIYGPYVDKSGHIDPLFYGTCQDYDNKDYIPSQTPPDWNIIKFLDLKTDVEVFKNSIVLSSLNQFLTNNCNEKLLHIVNCRGASLFNELAWNDFVQLTYNITTKGNVYLEIYSRFHLTDVDKITSRKIKSVSFYDKCISRVSEINFSLFSNIKYSHCISNTEEYFNKLKWTLPEFGIE